MITPIPAGQPWTRADLTGNSSFVQTDTGDIFVVSNSQTDNRFYVFKSTDYGATFSNPGGATGVFTSPNPQFDPVVFHTNNKIYILGLQPSSSDSTRVDLVGFIFDTTDNTLSSPVPLVTGSKTRSAFDMLQLETGELLIIAAVTDSTTPAIVGNGVVELKVAADFTPSAPVIILQSPAHSGNMYGAVSLVNLPDQGEDRIALFYTSHDKVISNVKSSQYILRKHRDRTTGVWGDEEIIYRYTGDLIDDKLTAITDGEWVVFSHLYYTKIGKTLRSTMVLGIEGLRGGELGWIFRELNDENIAEPTLSCSVSGPSRI